MILVTKINGARLAVNSDLIQKVESTPDTVITLVDGTKLLVVEPVEFVIDRIRDFRASILVAAERLRDAGGSADLRLVGADERQER